MSQDSRSQCAEKRPRGVRVFTRLLCVARVGDWQAGGREVPSAEGDRRAAKGEGQAGARPGGAPSHLQEERLGLRVRRAAVRVRSRGHQAGAGRHQYSETAEQATHQDRKAQAKDEPPQQVWGLSLLLRCCCCRVRVAPHAGPHLHALAHTLHRCHGLHLSVRPAGHQRLGLAPCRVPPGKSPAVPEPGTLRHRAPSQQQQRRPIRSLPALPHHPYSVIAACCCHLARNTGVRCDWIVVCLSEVFTEIRCTFFL